MTRKFDLFMDTDSDVDLNYAIEHDVKLISMPYIIDEKEIYPYKDWKDWDYKDFFQKERDGLIPGSAGISPAAYKEYFEPSFKAGRDILYVHFSAAMSGTFNAMKLAVDELKKEYPGVRFETLDTKGFTIMAYKICDEVRKLADEGKTIDEIKKWAETEVDHFATYFFADNLKFFGKSGRVSGIAAFMGGIIGIRPIINMSAEGKMGSIGKARGRSGALTKIAEYVKTLGDHVEDYECIVAHCDCEPLAIKLVEIIEKEL
ncbi:MAG: DegV family EDD domain-containing protein, partial [Bacilli bacterium]|nr:DegV family EDD domain-containing protein [Bacilli bacterium]